MTTPRNPNPRDADRLINAFLGEGQTDLPEQVYDEVRLEIEHTEQRTSFGPWRNQFMNRIAPVLAVATVLVLAVFVAIQLAGGGPLIDLGVHMVDMAIFLMGEPEVESVSCATYAELGPRGRGGRGDFGLMQDDKPYEVEDLATAFIRLSGGATLTLEAGWAAYREASDDFGVTLYGTDGGAEMKVKNYGTSDTVRIYTDVAGVPAVVMPEIEPREGHYAVVRRFVETIRGNAWEGQYGEDGLNRARIIDACYASALQNREVSMQEIITEEAV